MCKSDTFIVSTDAISCLSPLMVGPILSGSKTCSQINVPAEFTIAKIQVKVFNVLKCITSVYTYTFFKNK